MSEASDILDAIKTQFETEVSYVTWSVCEDEDKLEDNGTFPLGNLDIYDMSVTDADNQRREHMERRVYPIVILFENRNLIKSYVKLGDGVSFKGIFEIYDDIKAAIYTDITFGNVVSKFPMRFDFSSDVSKHENEEFWIGRAMIVFNVYKDVSLV